MPVPAPVALHCCLQWSPDEPAQNHSADLAAPPTWPAVPAHYACYPCTCHKATHAVGPHSLGLPCMPCAPSSHNHHTQQSHSSPEPGSHHGRRDIQKSHMVCMSHGMSAHLDLEVRALVATSSNVSRGSSLAAFLGGREHMGTCHVWGPTGWVSWMARYGMGSRGVSNMGCT